MICSDLARDLSTCLLDTLFRFWTPKIPNFTLEKIATGHPIITQNG